MSENHKNPKKMKSQVHCPVSGCLYSSGSERYFSDKKLLNQHIAKVHAEKKFPCAKCQKSFGTDYYRRYHEQTCGIEWKCHCGIAYPSRLSLLTHARRNQHKLPDHVIYNDKMKQNKTTSKPMDNPVIVLIQPIIQNVTCIQPPQKSVVTPRRILPKTTPPVLLTLSIPPNVLATTPSQNVISPVMHETQTKDNLVNSVQSLSPEDSINLTPNQIFSTAAGNATINTQEKLQASIATQTDDSLDDTRTKTCQSQASQCNRHKRKTLNVGIESTHTQTAESAVVKIKKRRSRRKSVAITTETSGLTGQTALPENSFWPGLKDFLPLGDNQGTRLFKNSASTQTSSLNNKVLCDSETITDQDLFKFSWEDAMKLKENETCDAGFQVLSDIGADTLKIKENETSNTDFQVLSEIGADSLKVKENETCNTDFQLLSDIGPNDTLSALPVNVDNNPLEDLNILSNPLNSFSEIKSSINDKDSSQANVTEKGSLEEKPSMFSVFGDCVRSDIHSKAPTLSDIHTQTMASAILDFNLLANMETQTTDDFSLSDLEFSETETQTPWEDFPNIDDSPLQIDQLSIEIQTDPDIHFPAFPSGLNLDPYELINSVDLQNISGYTPKESLGVSTETQTLDQFSFPQFTNSESQTLDMPDFMFDSLSS